MTADPSTIAHPASGSVTLEVPRFTAIVLEGRDAGATATSEDGRMTIGTAEGVSLLLSDPTVSRYHLELEATAGGITLRDLGSTNGTRLGSALVRELVARESVELWLGGTRVRIEVGEDRVAVPASSSRSFGELIGGSPAMRALYTVLERAAPTTAPVLISGESGTGKELAARAVHAASPRARMPFEVVDCGGLSPTLIEAELFGYDRGAFTGAVGEREGAFERADGGTLFLDELGELPLDVQPKLLRVLGEREVRRVGGTRSRRVDVRVVAATNRDLRREVNQGTFRADLFYRLAVIQVRMPSLRERLEDLPALVKVLLARIERDRGLRAADIELDVDRLLSHGWPGNVRELRNYLEQLVILKVAPPLSPPGDGHGAALPTSSWLAELERLPLHVAAEQFERHYVARMLAQTRGNIPEAARQAGVGRATMYRLAQRYGLKPGS